MSVHNSCHQVVESLSLQRVLRMCRDPLKQVVQERRLVGYRKRDLFMEGNDCSREEYKEVLLRCGSGRLTRKESMS